MSDTRNPYLPPKAVVAEVSDEAPRVRPVAMTVALYLIGARMFLEAALMVLPRIATSPPRPVSLHVMAALFVAVTGVLAYCIARGRNWARIVYLLLTILGLAWFLLVARNMLRALPGVNLVSDMSLRWFVTVLVPQLLSIAVVVLLFGPGRAWFRARG